MKTFKNSRRAGISLVALVITIIVLIILTGAVIVTFMEGGIIDRAKESVFKNDMRTYQEILALKRAENQMEIALGEKEDVEINASSLEEIQAIIPEFKEEYEGLVIITRGELSIGERVTGEELSSSEELYSTWLSDLGIGLSRLPKNALASYANVGDYVVYSPDGEIPSDLPINLTRQNINWRVLKNDGRQVTLISETPIDSITLEGAEGFLNGPSNIDETYKGLYSGTKGTSRNLKDEDIISLGIVKERKAHYTAPSGELMYIDEGTTIGEVEEQLNERITNRNTPQTGKLLEDYEISYFDYVYELDEDDKQKAYDLVFKTLDGRSNSFLLSSNSIFLVFAANFVDFHISEVGNGTIDIALSGVLYSSTGVEGTVTGAGRPIVILNTDAEVSNPSAGGNTVDTAWQLK